MAMECSNWNGLKKTIYLHFEWWCGRWSHSWSTWSSTWSTAVQPEAVIQPEVVGHIMTQIGFNLDVPIIKIYVDNVSAINLTKNQGFSSKK